MKPFFKSMFDDYTSGLTSWNIYKVLRGVYMIRNWYNQIPHPVLKTKREITKYIKWRQFTKGTRGKPNEQLFPK